VDEEPVDTSVRIVTIVCLTVIVITAIVGITITSVMTDRDVHYAEGLSFAGAVLVAVIGGFTLAGLRRHKHRRWRIEHDENGGD
jgi:membrane protein YdbS with pleckstrin-like domain